VRVLPEILAMRPILAERLIQHGHAHLHLCRRCRGTEYTRLCGFVINAAEAARS